MDEEEAIDESTEEAVEEVVGKEKAEEVVISEEEVIDEAIEETIEEAIEDERVVDCEAIDVFDGTVIDVVDGETIDVVDDEAGNMVVAEPVERTAVALVLAEGAMVGGCDALSDSVESRMVEVAVGKVCPEEEERVNPEVSAGWGPEGEAAPDPVCVDTTEASGGTLVVTSPLEELDGTMTTMPEWVTVSAVSAVSPGVGGAIVAVPRSSRFVTVINDG